MPPISRSACLTKLDGSGNVVWTRGYEVNQRSRGIAVRRANDNPNHFVMVGHADLLNGGDHRVFLMKTDNLGNPLWTFTYGEAPGRQFRQKMELRNVEGGGYIVSGSVNDGLLGLMGFLLRVDDSGGLMWMRFYPQPGAAFNFVEFHDVQPTPEGFVVTGYAPSQFPPGPSQNSLDTLVMTTDAFGNPIWAKQYANLEGNQGGESITLTPAGGYAVVGGHLPTLLDSYTTELFSVDASGGLNWYNRLFGVMDAGSHFKNQQIANGDLRTTLNGELIFVGGDFGDAAILKYDGFSGAYVNGMTYGFANYQWGASYVIEPSGFFTLVGPSSDGLDLEYYVVRTDPNFMSGCNEAPIEPPMDHPDIIVVDTAFEPFNESVVTAVAPVDVPLTWTEIVLCANNPCLDPFTVTCTLASGDVTLNWGPAQPLVAMVEVRRNGSLLTTLPGTAVSYTDTSPVFGSNTYEVTLIHSDPACDRVAASCSKWVGFIVVDVITDVIFSPWKPVPDQPIICWADDLETKGRTPRVITNIADISPDLASGVPGVTPIVWLSLGEFPDQHVLSDEEGQVLAEFLAAGGSLYIEGGDVGFGPPTPLSSMDGVIATDDGANDGSVVTLIGLDSGVGANASALSSDYTGTGKSVDHLAPDGNGAGPLFQNGGGEGQVTSVYYDASVSGSGDHRVITSSTTYEGYAGDRSALLDLYLDALSPPVQTGAQFVRGECNGDGNLDIGDGIYTLGNLFSQGAEGPCHAACDANGDGGIDIGDAIYLFGYLLLGGTPPPAPFPDCGEDATSEAIFGCLDTSNCP
ncbi:MAG: hypothetical protein AAF488_00945 [Planctomycetota bacterium]